MIKISAIIMSLNINENDDKKEYFIFCYAIYTEWRNKI